MKSKNPRETAPSCTVRQPDGKVAKQLKMPPKPVAPGPTARTLKVATPSPAPPAIHAIDYGLSPPLPAGCKPQPRHREIRERAYLIWEKAGRPEGKELAHWLEAEAQVRQSSNGDHPAMPQPHPAGPVNGSRRRLLDLIIKA